MADDIKDSTIDDAERLVKLDVSKLLSAFNNPISSLSVDDLDKLSSIDERRRRQEAELEVAKEEMKIKHKLVRFITYSATVFSSIILALVVLKSFNLSYLDDATIKYLAGGTILAIIGCLTSIVVHYFRKYET